MKRLFKTILCITLAACALFTFSCSDKRDSYAIYGISPDGKIAAGMTEGMFSYFLSQQKVTYYTVLRFNDPTITADSPEIWEKTSPEGVAYGERFYEDVIKEARELITANTILYSMPSPDGKGNYTLPEEYTDYVNSLVTKNAIEKYGSVMAFENYLLNFGATLEDYTNLYIMTANVDLLKEAMFDDNTGLYRISEEEKKKYYEDNYYSVRHIFINTAYDEKIDGTRAPLTEAEAAKRKDISGQILSFIKSGATFEEAAESFTQKFVTVYPGAAQMDITSSTANAPELGEALKTMSIGEVRAVNSAYGVHILERVPTDPDTYDDDKETLEAIRSAIANKLYPEIIEANSDIVTVNQDITGKYSLADAIMP